MKATKVFTGLSSQHSLTRRSESAFGGKADIRRNRSCVGVTLLTQSGHERPAFAALHGPDLLYLTSNHWVGG